MAGTLGSIASRVFVAGSLALVIGCGGGGGGGSNGSGGGGGGVAVNGVTPANLSASGGTSATITGIGFGAAGTAVVRLTAASGTPFANGTAGAAEVPGTIVDDATITFTSPAARLCPSAPVGLNVRVTLPGGASYDSPPAIATLVGPILGGCAPSTVPSGVATPVSLNGSGFGPLSSAATVLFAATSGTPFQGGTSAQATVSGTVTSASTVAATSPLASTSVDFTAGVTITFSNGSCVAVAGLVTFAKNRAPTLSTSVSGDLLLALGDRVSFTVTATDPDGDPVTLRLLNPPNGCTFPRVVDAASPKTVTVEWVVDSRHEGGPNTLVFRGNDATGGSQTLLVRTHLTPYAVRTLRLGDVTGDGKPDVVVCARNADQGGLNNTGAIYVWAGATTPSGTPTASLTVPGAAGADALTTGGFRLEDVTGDGVRDVVAATDQVDVSGATNAGALYVWKRGSGLTGSKSPDATLTAGTPTYNSWLGSQIGSWQTGDVTGDGVKDVVATAFQAATLYVWKGGSGLSGAKTADATLVGSGAGQGATGNPRLVDLTGDGVLDVFAGAPYADPGGVAEAGALYLWKGGSGLSGTVTPDASMTVASPTASNVLGAQTLRFADVTQDGVVDVVAGVSPATVGSTTLAGAIYMWKGGSGLTGTKTEDATLTVSGAVAGDTLSGTTDGGVLVGDVSGDGVPDIVGVSQNGDVGGVSDVGAAYLWKGGSGLSGSKTQDASMTVPGAASGDALGRGGARLVDLTNDGALDIVCAAPFADANGTSNSGAVYVWAGGSSLAGAVSPTASLAVTGAVADDRLADETTHQTFTPRFGDVSGDGIFDVVVPATLADVGGLNETGAIYAWKGGSSLTGSPAPTATLTVAGAAAGDRLGNPSSAYVALGDVSGDGTLDVLSGAGLADAPGAVNAGALYLWKGGSGLTGSKTADATLKVSGALAGDSLTGGASNGTTWDIVDLTGDGTRNVVAIAPQATRSTLSGAGAAYLWAGGSGLLGSVNPTATFYAPNATNADALGATGGSDLLVVFDLTGDGIVDLMVGAPSYTGTGNGAAGGVFLWRGGSGLTGTPAATTSFLVPGASVLDNLGY